VKRHGVEAEPIVSAAADEPSLPDDNLIALIARADLRCDQVATGKIKSIFEISERERIHASDVGRTTQLASLAPESSVKNRAERV